MSRFYFSDEHKEFVRISPVMLDRKLTKNFNTKFGTDYSVKKVTGLRTSLGLLKNNNLGKPVGSERVGVGGSGKYVLIKTTKGTWERKTRVVWESCNQKLTKNESIVFKDGNKLNFDISNLEKITKQEQLTRAKINYSQLPLQLKPVAANLVRLMIKISSLNKNYSK